MSPADSRVRPGRAAGPARRRAELDRAKVRLVAEERFSSARMVADDLALYEQVGGAA